MSAPIVTNVRRRNGIAGQYQVSASVQHEGEAARTVTFVGYGFESRTIVMCTPGNPGGTFVASSVVDRLGAKLDEAWVRAFFAPKAGEL
jgi:histidinol-phosphate/aromatic aminotransferase/cobyric acid decarboxylase-like protein